MNQGINFQGIKEKAAKITALKIRTFEFSKKAIDLVYKLPKNNVNEVIGNQFLRSSTSIGAIYREADGTNSKKDLKYKMVLIKKEAKETYYWLGLLDYSNRNREPNLKELIMWLINESKELTLIFSKIVMNLNL